ncbi:hypothetical protein VTH82DRAFT_6643 [Thermothelomyces myriococcoides]
MIDSDGSWPAESQELFWDALNKVLSSSCATPEELDETLRSWLNLVTKARDDYLETEDDVARCSEMLLESQIFRNNSNYVRTQIIYSLLQEDEFAQLHVYANFLLLAGRTEEDTFRAMIHEGCFVRLLELIKCCGGRDGRLHRLLLQLMYEMSRIERLRPEDLLQIDDNFVIYLFQLIEAVSDDASDPYHYAVIRVLLVLNEQYMVASTSAAVDPSSATVPVTNRVIKVLSVHGPSFRTFGENIILLLNRETETSQQLLILKLLYLLFTTAATYEYFYLNDLRVLLDVIIRNGHFMPPEPTTLRLLERVAKTPWLVTDELNSTNPSPVGSPTHSQTGSSVSVVANVSEKPGVQTPSRKLGSGLVSKETELPTPAEGSSSKPKPPPPRTLRPKASLPEVPKHRHGSPLAQPAVTDAHVNGNGQKKAPPKIPPPRRKAKALPATGGDAPAMNEPLPTPDPATSVS